MRGPTLLVDPRSWIQVIARSDNHPANLTLQRDVCTSMFDAEIFGLRREIVNKTDWLKIGQVQADETRQVWLVRHAAHVINRERIGADGRTPP